MMYKKIVDKQTIVIAIVFGLPALLGLTTSFLGKLPSDTNNLPINNSPTITQTTLTPTETPSTTSATPTQAKIQRSIRSGEFEKVEE